MRTLSAHMCESELTTSLPICPSYAIFRLTGAIILRITYGIDVQEEQDSFVTLIQKANDNFNVATAPGKFDDLNSRLRGIDWFSGAFLVDVFPAMLHIPEILAPWKRTARIWARATKNMVEAPYLFVQRQMVFP